MMEEHLYREKDFAKNYTIWRGNKRDVSLDGWVLDRYNNKLYKESVSNTDDSTLCIKYTKSDEWEGVFITKDNGIIWKKRVSSDNLGDLILEANEEEKKYIEYRI